MRIRSKESCAWLSCRSVHGAALPLRDGSTEIPLQTSRASRLSFPWYSAAEGAHRARPPHITIMRRLTKWYCDCVTDSGDVVIGYWARLAWGPVRFPYIAVLRRTAAGEVSERVAFRFSSQPAIANGRLTWDCRRLGLTAHWSALLPPIHITLVKSKECVIEWWGQMPAAEAYIDFAGGERLVGVGYAEWLSITLTGRRLPFEELRWGRFVSRTASLVWIQWRGTEPKSWAVLNGHQAPDVVVGDTAVHVASAGARLTLLDPALLRDARVLDGALLGNPLVRCLMRGIPGAHETKWRSAGTLVVAGEAHTGWAIHETVCFA